MGAFEEFIESDAFFPVLIGVLLLLIIVFVVILIIDRKREKKYIQDMKEEIGNDNLDLTQTIKIPIKKVVKQVVVNKPIEEKKKEPIKKEDKQN